MQSCLGIPISWNNKPMKLHELIAVANKTGATHGVGVVQLIEDRIVGLKVRGVYENPGANILIAAHKKLEMLVSTREENELKPFMDQKWSYLTYGAKYYEPTMRHIESYINDQNDKVTGIVRVELYKGNITIISLKSDNSLFNQQLATFERTQGLGQFNQNASAGFIELYTLPMRTAVNVHNQINKQQTLTHTLQ